MRKFLTFLIALAAIVLGVCSPASTQQSILGFPPGIFDNIAARSPAPAVSYTGPGDVVSGANAWYGLRAYSLADRGNALVNACNIADSTCSDINSSASTGNLTSFTSVGGSTCSWTISSGTYTTATGAVSLTMASGPGLVSTNIFGIANLTGTGTFSSLNGVFTATTGTTGTTVNYTAATGLGTVTITGGTLSICSIKTWYDRSAALSCGGSACTATQATIVSRAFLIGSCINSLPCAVFGGAQSYSSAATVAASVSSNNTVSLVASRYANFTAESTIFGLGNSSVYEVFAYRNVANTIQMYNGASGQTIANITDSNFHAFQANFSATGNLMCGGGAGTNCSTAGTTTSINPGTSGWLASSFYILGNSPAGSQFAYVYFTEAGQWNTIFTGTNQTNMNANQYTFWGPF